jgi:hypothetical protein
LKLIKHYIKGVKMSDLINFLKDRLDCLKVKEGQLLSSKKSIETEISLIETESLKIKSFLKDLCCSSEIEMTVETGVEKKSVSVESEVAPKRVKANLPFKDLSIAKSVKIILEECEERLLVSEIKERLVKGGQEDYGPNFDSCIRQSLYTLQNNKHIQQFYDKKWGIK